MKVPILTNSLFKHTTGLDLTNSTSHVHTKGKNLSTFNFRELGIRPLSLICNFLFAMLMTQSLLYMKPLYRISFIIFSVLIQSDKIYMENTYTTQPSDKIPFSCTECDFSFSNYSIHTFEHTGDYLLLCTKCDYLYNLLRILLHMILRKNFIFNV